MRHGRGALLAALLAAGCGASTDTLQHGTISGLTARGTGDLCAHRVPGDVCVQCHPDLAGRFQAAKDWCPEHAIPESQCLLCHPDLDFSPLPALPPGADVAVLSAAGEDVPELVGVPGKVTVFDFHASWCAPCRKVEAFLRRQLASRPNLAVRKLDIVSWDTPLAKRWLGGVPTMPYLVVVGAGGERVAAISGFDLPALERAIAAASGP